MIFMTTQSEKIVGTMSTRYSWLQSKTKDIVDAKISRIARCKDCLSSTRRSMEIYLLVYSIAMFPLSSFPS